MVLQFEYERAVAATRAQLDERAFADDWASGQALSLEQAIAEAREVAETVAKRAAQPTETDDTTAEFSAISEDVGTAAAAGAPANVIPLRPRGPALPAAPDLVRWHRSPLSEICQTSALS